MSSADVATGKVNRVLIESRVEGDEDESGMTKVKVDKLHGGEDEGVGEGACPAMAAMMRMEFQWCYIFFF